MLYVCSDLETRQKDVSGVGLVLRKFLFEKRNICGRKLSTLRKLYMLKIRSQGFDLSLRDNVSLAKKLFFLMVLRLKSRSHGW